MTKKICVVTGTRAEYGLLSSLMLFLREDAEIELQIIATGSHLSHEFGLTYKTILEDGFMINERIEMILSSDTAVGVTKSIGLGIIGFADGYERLKPDLVVLLGDRYEILAAAQAALIAKLPIAHIGGGDVTQGAYDEAIRHSITKMSHLHFVTNKESGERVRQLGENPKYIYNVGSPGIDLIKNMELANRKQLSKLLSFSWKSKNALVTFHPSTLDKENPSVQFERLLAALSRLGDDFGIIITKPNADSDGRMLIRMIEDFEKRHNNVKSYVSLGQYKYLSTMAQVDVVIGNSSSGLYEAPSFKKPTVNIGDRQRGRLLAESVLNCEPEEQEIYESIQRAISLDCEHVFNPYGEGESSVKIYEIIKSFSDYKHLIIKEFHQMGFSNEQ
ncbi:UDP-N-acetylglucosamine 2-epimerase [Paenibacillus qinlingensis]|uniref:UDP-N-acetylglucosamine 2-epimerase n=1 Tax=Paenibacillus qinlingensis TaxID=1837343 RepID=UPI00156457F5|nr:UDP-N-acetylglucosamine 2-epimerase [Paenibacillus qinlingensis]NQX61921.1 UDP-N-acetylglucosamine 2-epimerase (hydrolyzing) [Paenibacillus qinlingensis]